MRVLFRASNGDLTRWLLVSSVNVADVRTQSRYPKLLIFQINSLGRRISIDCGAITKCIVLRHDIAANQSSCIRHTMWSLHKQTRLEHQPLSIKIEAGVIPISQL